VALSIDKVIFMPFNSKKNLTEFAKTEDNLKAIDTETSLQDCLNYINKTPKLNPLDLE